jgi:hypothetical protein
MIDLQQATEAVKTLTKSSNFIELGVGGIFALLIIDRVLAWALKFKGKGNGKTNGLNPGYVAQVQNHMGSAIAANTKIDSIDQKTDKLCECLAVLANNEAAHTKILEKISDSQIAIATKISFDKDPNRY